MLTGQAKKDYQREYMRKKRAKEALIALRFKKNVCATEVRCLAEEAGLTDTTLDPAHCVRPSVRPILGELTKERQISKRGFNG